MELGVLSLILGREKDRGDPVVFLWKKLHFGAEVRNFVREICPR